MMHGRQLELGVPRTTEADLRRAADERGAWEADTADEPDEASGLAILRRNPMMRHLLEALERGDDIGHYGRLVFAMVAHHFLDDAAVVGFLERDPAIGRDEAEAMTRQVRERDYNPPRPERIADWQRSQTFPICPEGDPRKCNVYRDLRFPEDVYEHIEEFREGRDGGHPNDRRQRE